jgi:predicted N-acetyltransferase YhbS
MYHFTTMTTLPLLIRREEQADAEAIERLHERAFGPGRFARTAFRLREGAGARPDLCFTAHVGTYLVGSIRLSPITLGGMPGLVLGPVAVEPAFMNRGIGHELIAAALDAARKAEDRLVILIGDEPYYRRAGFSKVPEGRLVMPGPVDPTRLLWLELVPGAAEATAGAVMPAEARGRDSPSPPSAGPRRTEAGP